MGNDPRYVPPGSLVEVTTRTIHGRLLLVPSRDLNDIVCGVLARALSRYRVELVDFKIMGNHVLCAALHNTCYVEPRIMWSWRARGRRSGRRARLSSA